MAHEEVRAADAALVLSTLGAPRGAPLAPVPPGVSHALVWAADRALLCELTSDGGVRHVSLAYRLERALPGPPCAAACLVAPDGSSLTLTGALSLGGCRVADPLPLHRLRRLGAWLEHPEHARAAVSTSRTLRVFLSEEAPRGDAIRVAQHA